MTNNDKARCFVLLAKLSGHKLSDEEKFARLVQISSYRQKLEGLYRKLPIQHKNQATLNVLFKILQVQEVGKTEEYSVHGFVFKVHVLEDTNF